MTGPRPVLIRPVFQGRQPLPPSSSWQRLPASGWVIQVIWSGFRLPWDLSSSTLHRGSDPPLFASLLREALRGPHFSEVVMPGVPSLCPQLLPQGSSLLDGDRLLGQGRHPPWGLGHIDRPQGGLLPPPYPPARPQVAALRLGGSGASVSGPPFQVSPGPLTFPHGGPDAVPSCPHEGHLHQGVPERLADTGRV